MFKVTLQIPYTIVIHGGAGVVDERFIEVPASSYEASLEKIIDSSFEVLRGGGSALDAVTAAVRLLEDDPLFNAGYGAGLARNGSAELDAGIMCGESQRAGAVAVIRHIRNPVELARRVMEKSEHVMLVGSGAEEFALSEGFSLVPNDSFKTPYRLAQLERHIRGEQQPEVASAGSFGTVGAVALDQNGNLASATSTGGLTNKLPGRVGDSPLIGAGTYANNDGCAVSTTGQGEFFIRSVAAHRISLALEYGQMSLAEAVHETLHEAISKLGGLGGIIAVDRSGNYVMDFNTQGMFRAARDWRGNREIGIGSPAGTD